MLRFVRQWHERAKYEISLVLSYEIHGVRFPVHTCSAYPPTMDIDRYLHDLEAQFAHAESTERRAVSEDLERAERAQVLLADRLRGSRGRVLSLSLIDPAAPLIAGRVEEVGDVWVSLHGHGEEVLILLRAVEGLEGLSERARPVDDAVASAPAPLGRVLRRWARDRSTVRVRTRTAERMGRLAGVHADHIDLLMGDDPLVPARTRRTVPLDAILSIARRGHAGDVGQSMRPRAVGEL